MRAKGRRGKAPSRELTKRKSEARSSLHVARGSKPYSFLDHPADVGFEVRAKTLPEIFAGAALALCDYGWELATIRPRRSLSLRARAATLEDLLFSWLAEILFLTDAEGWVFREFRVSRVVRAGTARRKALPYPTTAGRVEPHATPPLWEIVGEARGEKFAKKRHRSRTYIKAVTYHQLSVQQSAAGCRATVYLDV